MKKLASVLVVTLALLLSACGGTPPQPIDVITPAPWPGGTSATPQTTPSTEPTQEELSAQAEQAYRAFFNEWTRLELEGGAAEPTPILLENGAEKYLEGVMLFLREQKEVGYTVEGVSTTTVVPRPGESALNSDPRLTLAVCEDATQSWYTDVDGRHQGQLLQGAVYLKEIDGRPKVIWANTAEVSSCDLF